MILIPETTCCKKDKSTLWNNLPYCGLYNSFPIEGKVTNLDTPVESQVSLSGRPLPLINNGVNKNLRLIGFDFVEEGKAVYTVQPWRLVPFSPWLEYRIKWSTSAKCIIGFYTTNYLSDPDLFVANRRTLLIGNDGPCIFENDKGVIYFTETFEFYVIVDKDVTVSLDVKCRAPCELFFPRLKLYKPMPYELEDGTIFAYETKVTSFTGNVVFEPTKEYARLANAIRKYITDTSIVLDFSSTVQSLKFENTPPLELNGLGLIIRGALLNDTWRRFFPKVIESTYQVLEIPFTRISIPVVLVIPASTNVNEQLVTVEYVLSSSLSLKDVKVSSSIQHWSSGRISFTTAVNNVNRNEEETEIRFSQNFNRSLGNFSIDFDFGTEKSLPLAKDLKISVTISYGSSIA